MAEPAILSLLLTLTLPTNSGSGAYASAGLWVQLVLWRKQRQRAAVRTREGGSYTRLISPCPSAAAGAVASGYQIATTAGYPAIP